MPRLLDAVLGDDALKSSKAATWFDALPEDIQGELDQIKAAFKAGVVPRGRKTLARTISKHLNERGLSKIGHNGVDVWLAKD